jgi:hypothetical protein
MGLGEFVVKKVGIKIESQGVYWTSHVQFQFPRENIKFTSNIEPIATLALLCLFLEN